MRSRIAEECKNDYAAQLQKCNKEQNQFYFNDMPVIFNVSGGRKIDTRLYLPARVIHCNLIVYEITFMTRSALWCLIIFIRNYKTWMSGEGSG